MKKLFLSCMVFVGFNVSAYDKADALRAEIYGYNKPNLSPETQPALFALVAELSEKAGVPTPKYISMFNATYQVVPKDGGPMQTHLRTIDAHIDMAGDLYICWDVLTMLSYDEIRGVLALGLASKAQNIPWKQAKMFVGTLVSALATQIYLLKAKTNYSDSAMEVADQECENKFIKFITKKPTGQERDFNEIMLNVFGVALIPSLATTYLYSNSLQKGVDFTAADIAEARNIIKGIQGLARITASYQKEGLWSRYAPENLKKACNILFYYVRPFNDTERVTYLRKKVRSKK